MPVKVEELRPAPLLTPPTAKDYWPCTAADVGCLRGHLERLTAKDRLDDTGLRQMAGYAVALKGLGAELPYAGIERHRTDLEGLLDKDSRSDVYAWPFTCYAANLSRLGFGVAGYSRMIEGRQREEYAHALKSKAWFDVPIHAAKLREVGLDVDVKADIGVNRARIFGKMDETASKGHWSDFANMASSMRRLGFNVDAHVRPHSELLIAHIGEARLKESPSVFASYVAHIAEIMPRQKDGSGGEDMPPLKRFRK